VHVIEDAVTHAPIASDQKLPLLVELRGALRDLSSALDAPNHADHLGGGAPHTQRNGTSQLSLASATVGTVQSVGTSSVAAPVSDAPHEDTGVPTAASAESAHSAAETFQIRNWSELSARLDELTDYLSASANVHSRQDLSVVETVVTRMRDQSTLRPPEFVAEARLLVSTIRETINEYRDDSRAGLVRARNQLGWTCIVTALCAYAVVWLAVATGVPAAALQVGVAYFLVGALVGLFSRLHSDLGADTATDDYGLSTMRLIAAPQLAGVAAVTGVALLALTGMTGGDGVGNQGLQKAFELPLQGANMLAAAAFGLAPGLLIDRLKQQTESLKGNLQATVPQSTTSARREPA
jgi:hypothetical protein